MDIVSFVLGLIGLFSSCIIIGIIPSIISFILGIIVLAKGKKEKGLAIAGIVLSCIAFVISGFVLIIGSQDGKTESEETPTEISTAELSDKNEPAEGISNISINGCSVTYLRHEIDTNMSDEKCVVVYYEFTNNSDTNHAFDFTVDDQAFQDGIELKASLFHVNDESKDGSIEIQPGKTITVCSAFVLRDGESDVELQVKPFMSLRDKPDASLILKLK